VLWFRFLRRAFIHSGRLRTAAKISTSGTLDPTHDPRAHRKRRGAHPTTTDEMVPVTWNGAPNPPLLALPSPIAALPLVYTNSARLHDPEFACERAFLEHREKISETIH
jgi:hypothetical protein